MDQILLKVFGSQHAEPVRVAVIRQVTSHALATPTGGAPTAALSAGAACCAVRAGAFILAGAQSPEMAQAALFVIQQFSECHMSTVLQSSDVNILEPLLSSSCPPPSCAAPTVLQLLSWLLDSCAVTVGRQLPQLVDWMGGGDGEAAAWLAALSDWLMDQHTALLESCAVGSLVESLTRVLTRLASPVAPPLHHTLSPPIGQYRRHLAAICRLLTDLLAADRTGDVITRAMHLLYTAMATSEGKTCTGLSVVVLSFPQQYIQPACHELVRKYSCGVVDLLPSLCLLADWLPLWPRLGTLSLWLLLLIKQLAAAGHSQLLEQLVNARVEKLFSALMLPALRRAVFPVVSVLLLGYQHSADAFNRVMPLACVLVQRLRADCVSSADDQQSADSAELNQLAVMLYTLAHQHQHRSQCDTSQLLSALQGVASPSVSRMNAYLAAAAWRSTSAAPSTDCVLASGATTASAATSMTVSRHRGLTNLGNTCFMNSVIQALFAVNSFREAVLCSRPASHHRLLSALQRVFAFLQFSALPVYSPNAFHQLALPPWFERGQQHDCSEFLRYMLNALHEEQHDTGAPPLSHSAPLSSVCAVCHDTDLCHDIRGSGSGDTCRNTPSTGACSADESPLLSSSSSSTSSSASSSACAASGVGSGGVMDCAMDGVDAEHQLASSSTGPVSTDSGVCSGGDEEAPCRADSSPCDRLSHSEVVPMDTSTCLTSTASALISVPSRLDSSNAATASDTVHPSLISSSPESPCSGRFSTENSPDALGTEPCSSSALLARCSADSNTISADSPPSPRPSAPQSAGRAARTRCSLVHRLLTGRMETSYRCLGCHTVSSHVDTFTDINLTFPEQRPAATVTAHTVATVDNSDHSSSSSLMALPADSCRQPLLSPPSVNSATLSDCAVATEPLADTSATGSADSSQSLHVCELFERYLSRERLTGDNRYWCDSCAALRDADRQLRLLSAPRCLLVSLSRFVYDRRSAAQHKLLTPVQLAQCLRVPVASAGGRQQQQQQQEEDGDGVSQAVYSLQAVVVHTGASLDGGHYYCCARTDTGAAEPEPAPGAGAAGGGAGADGEWWCFSDSSVTPVRLHDVLHLTERRPSETAYLLVYVRHKPSASEVAAPTAASAAATRSRQLQQLLPEGLVRDIRLQGGLV